MCMCYWYPLHKGMKKGKTGKARYNTLSTLIRFIVSEEIPQLKFPS